MITRSSIWAELAERFPPAPTENALGDELLTEYRSCGYVRRPCRALLELPEGVWIRFYAELAQQRSTRSPLADRHDSGWMAAADFCFVNLRATGLHEQPGNPLQAARILPGMRVNAIHLGPFTDYDFSTIYAPRGLRTIAPQLLHPACGLSPEQQLRAFVEAAHLLGMAVGFDLEPHVAQFGRPVLMHPDCFRWLHLSADRRSLQDAHTTDDQLEPVRQSAIAAEVRAIVQAQLAAHHLDDLEESADDPPELRDRRRRVYFALIGELIAHGYWPIPSQSWACRGTPAFAGYHPTGNYAQFEYRAPDGADMSGTAYHIVTPFAFYHGLHANRPSSTVAPNHAAIELYASLAVYWRDQFDFDFVRYDSVDHILDSLIDNNPDHPAADRPTPRILEYCVQTTKSPERPYIGNFAERMGLEIEAYAAMGFDLLLGTDMLRRIDRALIADSLHLAERLNALNTGRPTRFSVSFCLDTHDTGNPAIWGMPLTQLAGSQRMHLRHLVARFFGVGAARRPKYEVMGSQDGSYGLYAANISDTNLVWVGDGAWNVRYHRVEDLYTQVRPWLDQGRHVRGDLQDHWCWWAIPVDAGLLIAIIALDSDPPQPPGMITLNLEGLIAPGATAQIYDFNNHTPAVLTLESPHLTLELAALDGRIIWII